MPITGDRIACHPGGRLITNSRRRSDDNDGTKKGAATTLIVSDDMPRPALVYKRQMPRRFLPFAAALRNVARPLGSIILEGD